MKTNICAIILAGGVGSRMRSDVPKQRLVLDGKTLLYRCVETFENCDAITSIIVVSKKEEIEYVVTELSSLKKVKGIVCGGKTRAESASLGFAAIDFECDFVAIHDAARCLVTEKIIKSVSLDAEVYGAATASTIVSDTVKKVDQNKVVSTVNRDELRLMQTPQIFEYNLYKKALASVSVFDDTITDDNSLLERLDFPVHCTETGKYNIKVTVPEDIEYAKFLLLGGYLNAKN